MQVGDEIRWDDVPVGALVFSDPDPPTGIRWWYYRGEDTGSVIGVGRDSTGAAKSDLPGGHDPRCHGRGGRLRRWSAYHRIRPFQWGRWWERHPLPECGL